MTNQARAWTLALLLLQPVTSGCASRPAPPPRPLVQVSDFQILRGDSLIATEQVLTYPDRIEGSIQLIGRAHADYVAFFGESVRVRRLEARVTREGAAVGNAFNLDFSSDSVFIERTQPIPSSERHASGPAVPYLHPSPGLLEQIVRHAIRLGSRGGDSRVLRIWFVGYNRATDASLSFVSSRIVDVQIAGTRIRVWLDDFGILVAEVPSLGWFIHRQQR